MALSFFSTNRIGESHGDTLCLMKSLLRRSRSCTLRYFNSVRAIWHGGIEIGWVPNSTSMLKSVSYFGGRLGSSWGRHQITFGPPMYNQWKVSQYYYHKHRQDKLDTPFLLISEGQNESHPSTHDSLYPTIKSKGYQAYIISQS